MRGYKADAEKIRELAAAGKGDVIIAKKLGVSRATVYSYTRNLPERREAAQEFPFAKRL